MLSPSAQCKNATLFRLLRNHLPVKNHCPLLFLNLEICFEISMLQDNFWISYSQGRNFPNFLISYFPIFCCPFPIHDSRITIHVFSISVITSLASFLYHHFLSFYSRIFIMRVFTNNCCFNCFLRT